MLRKLITASLLLASFNAFGQFYLEVGIAKGDGGTCIEDFDVETHTTGCADSPLGNATIGYHYKGITAEVEHWSSIGEPDKGLNLFTIKYRYYLTK